MFFVLAYTPPSEADKLLVVFGIVLFVGTVIGIVAFAQQLKGSRPRRELRKHLGRDYKDLPVVTRSFLQLDLPNIRRAIDAYAAERSGRLDVLHISYNSLQDPKLTELRPNFQSVDVDVDEQESFLLNPLYLLSFDNGEAVAIRQSHDHGSSDLVLEVVAKTKESAEACLEGLRRLVRQCSIYRGKVISIEGNPSGNDYDSGWLHVRFHRLPDVSGDAIILPEETRRRIDRNTIGFFSHAAQLKAQGYSVKRGLLFHGPPGTGKTRTACWLTHSLPNVTVFLVTGEQLWNIKECSRLARTLAPAILILEDVDLIATRRDQSVQTTALHQLMNEMDGLDSDAEVMFLLTTNRPDEIEPALANRPGRIDQAIHFPLPDADCRRRLIELYRGRSTLAIRDWEPLLRETDGSSPAFIKELVRKAALIAVEANGQGETLTLADEHFREALHEMLHGGDAVTRRLVGFTANTERK